MRSSVRGESSIRVIDSRSLFMVAVKGGKCRGGVLAYAGPWKASQSLASKISSFTLHQAPESSIRVAVLAFTCAGVDKHEAP